jgi:hypothetical protein
MQTNRHPTQARRDPSGTHFILRLTSVSCASGAGLVEPMVVLVCMANLPGAPRRALDAAGLVLTGQVCMYVLIMMIGM